MKKPPFSDTEIHAEPADVLVDYLKPRQFRSPEWHRDARIPSKLRGLGIREVDDEAADACYQIDSIQGLERKR